MFQCNLLELNLSVPSKSLRQGMYHRLEQDPNKSAYGFPGGSAGKESVAIQETWVQSLGWEDTLKKGMATRSSILAWRIPWTV